jgi:site-specific DNA recombinase
MPTAAIYARYSSALQQPSSIEDQVVLCRRHAARLGYTVPDKCVYTDYEISGSQQRRVGYQRLLADAKGRVFEAILIEAQDRMWRNQAEMHSALNKLRFWRVRVLSVATGTDLTDRAGKLIATVTAWKDETYLDDLRDKTRRGMEGRIRRALSAGGRAFGYRSIPIHDRNRTDPYGQPVVVGYRRVIDEAEAAVVRRIFEMYANGLSAKAIVRRLNGEGVPPPRPRRGRRAQGWTWTTISGSRAKGIGILNNELYIGRLYWNKSLKDREPDTGKRVMRMRPRDEWVRVDAPDLRIIPDDLWARVKARQASTVRRASRYRGGSPPKHLFSGLLRCGVCGSHYIIKDSKYYACSFHINRGPDICPNNKFVRRTVVEEQLLAVIQQELFSPQSIADLTVRVNAALQRLSSAHTGDHERVTAELEGAERELDNIKSAIRAGIFTETTKAMLQETEHRIASLRIRLSLLEEPTVRSLQILPSVVERYLGELASVLHRDTDRSRQILSALVGEVTLRPQDGGLVAEIGGNVSGLLGLSGGNSGAGRGI